MVRSTAAGGRAGGEDFVERRSRIEVVDLEDGRVPADRAVPGEPTGPGCRSARGPRAWRRRTSGGMPSISASRNCSRKRVGSERPRRLQRVDERGRRGVEPEVGDEPASRSERADERSASRPMRRRSEPEHGPNRLGVGDPVLDRPSGKGLAATSVESSPSPPDIGHVGQSEPVEHVGKVARSSSGVPDEGHVARSAIEIREQVATVRPVTRIDGLGGDLGRAERGRTGGRPSGDAGTSELEACR